jgi:glycosyltransferase involved in cell wall biosynthesis
MKKPHIVFTMSGACGVSGGVAAVNLNILHALVDIVKNNGLRLTVFSYLEKKNDRPRFLPAQVVFRAFHKNRLSLAKALIMFAYEKPVYFFDYIRLALPILPFAVTNIVKVIIFAHGWEYGKLSKPTDCWSIQNASMCLTNSYYTLNKMRERFTKFNGQACPLGLSPEFTLNMEIPRNNKEPVRLQAADGRYLSLRKRVLLLVARMDKNERKKGHWPLVNIMPELLKEFPDVQLVLPGSGNDRQNLIEFAQHKGVASSVFLPGYVSNSVLKRLYCHCYVYVMPSLQEGFGLAYLEAMNCGKPCVGCFDQGAQDVVIHGETGYLIHNPEGSEELLEVLFTLLQEPKRAQMMGEKGFRRLHIHFTAEHFQKRIRKCIQSIL